ncbi:MAG: hypothetical protein R3B57_08630 [Phycisphaerales bacterium]
MAGDSFFYKGRRVCDDRLRLVPLVTAEELGKGITRKLRVSLNRATIRTWRWWAFFFVTMACFLFILDLALGRARPAGDLIVRSLC